MENEESVIKYEIRQTNLKKTKKKLKKKIPYFIFICISFGTALVILLEGVLNNFSANNSYSLSVIISVFFILLSLGYIIMMLLKINSINKEIKSLGEKMYHKMKL